MSLSTELQQKNCHSLSYSYSIVNFTLYYVVSIWCEIQRRKKMQEIFQKTLMPTFGPQINRAGNISIYSSRDICIKYISSSSHTIYDFFGVFNTVRNCIDSCESSNKCWIINVFVFIPINLFYTNKVIANVGDFSLVESF